MPLDLSITPLYRISGQDAASLPGFLALAPPPNAARGRERDRLMVYLLLAGNAAFSIGEYQQVAQDAAEMFYQTSGALTTALRAAAELVNALLLERNMKSSAQGQYAIGWLTLAALRDAQCTLALSGPMRVVSFSQQETRSIYEPAVSGKGLGANQSANVYYAQTVLSPGDRLLFFGRAPDEWSAALSDSTPASLDAMRRRLVTSTRADLNAVLMQATEGAGVFRVFSGTEEIKEIKKEEAPQREESTPAHIVQPAGYTTPPQTNPLPSAGRRDFPSSIPRSNKPVTGALPPLEEKDLEEPKQEEEQEERKQEEEKVSAPKRTRRREPSERMRQMAKLTATLIQGTRRAAASIGERLGIFLPRLLPNTEANDPLAVSTAMMFFMAVLIPLIVVTLASMVYFRYGRSQQYEMYLGQAKEMRALALTLSDPVEQRKAWENVLSNADIAESHRQTSETVSLRQEAEARRDQLLGIIRMQFNPAFSNNLGVYISRMAAGDTDIFMLNADSGEVLRAQTANNGRGFQLDTTFNCGPGQYGEYKVGPLVDILAMPNLNLINATLLGIDAAGNLLYCAPGQLAKAIPLPAPDTRWGRVTAFTMDSGNLYVLDAPARAVWVYTGKDGTFIDRPYFFFGGQTPEKQDVIDLLVSGDELFMLHADSHLSTCSYSRIESKPTRCEDPSPLKNPAAAYQDIDLFANSHFTQILFTAPPDSSLLLLDADTQSLLRFSPYSLELQNQLRPMTGAGNAVPKNSIDAVAVAPNHVLYIAVNGQVYFATNMP